VARAKRATSTKAAQSRPAAALHPSGVNITHPEKLLWPDVGISKQDLADYFARVSDLLFPVIADRPLSLVRTPDGVKGERFYQRHAMKGMSKLIETAKLPGFDEPYLVIRKPEALRALAQIAATELHPWGATVADIERPDFLVFDLDPSPSITFTMMLKAAQEIRERLKQYDLAAYVKLSGGKGFHVVVPVKPKADWKQAKAFARTLVEAMEADSPKLYTTMARKTKRRGRVFLDYLRNDKTSTAVAAWSPRARAGAPIAVPINWQLLEGKRALPVYTIKTVAQAIKIADPWKRFDADRRPIPIVE
jgi:bifunctional non-homologous end joining protein LigD